MEKKESQQSPEQKDFEPNTDDQKEGEHWLGWQWYSNEIPLFTYSKVVNKSIRADKKGDANRTLLLKIKH